MKERRFTEKFLRIASENTREEFDAKYEVYDQRLYLKGDYDSFVCDCPTEDGDCPDCSCNECWHTQIDKVGFKSHTVIEMVEPTSQRDYFLNEDNAYQRLVEEYRRYGNNFVIAYDFDSTIKDPHGKGRTCNNVIALLKKFEGKARFICFTARTPDRYIETIKYLGKNDIPCDKINEGFEGLSNGLQKPYYNVLLDDRAGLGEVYCILNRLYNEISK